MLCMCVSSCCGFSDLLFERVCRHLYSVRYDIDQLIMGANLSKTNILFRGDRTLSVNIALGVSELKKLMMELSELAITL